MNSNIYKEDRKKWKRDIKSYLDKNPDKEYTLTDIYNHFHNFKRSEGTLRSYLNELEREGHIQRSVLGYINLYSTKKETPVVEPPKEAMDLSSLVISINGLKESLDRIITLLEKKEPPQ